MNFVLLSRLISVLLVVLPAQLFADVIHIAVASNFREPAREIARRYEASSGHQVILSFGSTGKHYAQIKHGAPFDVFFAADVQRPELLEAEGLVSPAGRFTYARGRLVLWSPRKDYVDNQGRVLLTGQFSRLAIANPKLAPYGRAAQEVLQARGVWQRLQPHLVRGENIGQTYQFVKSGNAELGFVAYSQLVQSKQLVTGSYWLVPQTLYQPIEQQVVMLNNKPVVRDFIAYLQGSEAQSIIQAYGYDAK